MSTIGWREAEHAAPAVYPAKPHAGSRSRAADHRISRAEWAAAVPFLSAAARTWAPFEALRDCSAADFDRIDVNGGGFISLAEWCEWLAAAEVARCTPMGLELAGSRQ